MMISVQNLQRECSVDTALMGRVARSAVRGLRIRTPGTLAVTFIGASRMRALNKRFLRHDRLTDVLSFRYDGEPVVGEILIAPRAARAYAKRHGIAYARELARYVVHGLLHWMGYEDATPRQQRTMRAREDRILAQCAAKLPITKSQSPNNHQ